MSKISRARRAQIQRKASQIRRHGQMAGWDPTRITGAILAELPEVSPLEGCRLAHGWSRPHVLTRVVGLYEQAGLRAPAINSSMLCRWEHGETQPGTEYRQALCRLYRVRPELLGLLPDCARGTSISRQALRGRHCSPKMIQDDLKNARDTLGAVRESVQFAVELEGPGGGPFSRDQLDGAIQYYAQHYGAFPPGELAAEIHKCRVLVRRMLGHDQPTTRRSELRLLGGWLSALLGNLALHSGDYAAAGFHLRIATQLGKNVGHNFLVGWTLAAQSMLARYRHCYPESLNLARQAVRHVNSPLRRAQLISWAEVPALAHLGCRGEAQDALVTAQRNMDSAPEQSQPGRFGFDRAEFELHMAEAQLVLGNTTAAAAHTYASLANAIFGRPGWVAATLTLAQSEAQRGQPDQAAERGLHVLESVSPSMMRETSRQRLIKLDDCLIGLAKPGTMIADFHERIRYLPQPGPMDTLRTVDHR
jgi:hypothetical protein